MRNDSDDIVAASKKPPVSDSEEVSAGSVAREKEARATEKKMLSEIVKSHEATDKQAEQLLQEQLSEARLAQPEPSVPFEIADVGMVSPQEAADEVVKGGTSITLPISEEGYKRGLHLRVAGAVVDKVVVGASSLAALALWVGKVVKFAHKHTLRVIFKKEND